MLTWLLAKIGIAIVKHSSGALIATYAGQYIAGSMAVIAAVPYAVAATVASALWWATIKAALAIAALMAKMALAKNALIALFAAIGGFLMWETA